MANINVLMMAAGTGGHIFPALAVAKILADNGAHVEWLGTPNGMENTLVQKAGYRMHHVDMKGVRKKGLKNFLQLPARLVQSIWHVRRIITTQSIDVVVGFGGYVSFPGAVAAKLCKKALLIHEQNAVAGLSNRQLARYADCIMQAFDGAFAQKSKKMITTGNPVRDEFFQKPPPKMRFDATPTLKVLVVGGSLGAAAINQAIIELLTLHKRPLYVRHQCGQNNYQDMLVAYSQANIDKIHIAEPMAFIDDMSDMVAWADVLICRAGALTVAEICAVGACAIFVPLPQAVDDHQTKNAQTLVQQDAAMLLPQQELCGQSLSDLLNTLDKTRLLAMAQNAHKQALPEAAKHIANLIEQYAR